MRTLESAGQAMPRLVLTLALVALFTGFVALVRALADVDNASMLYLLAVIACALLYGSREAIVAAFASFFAYNFFFLQPRYTFTVAHEDEWLALALLLATGVIVGQLAATLQQRAREAGRREKEATVLYDIVRAVSQPDLPDALHNLAERLRSELNLAAIVISIVDERTAGDASASPAMIMSSGTPPSAERPARPGRWIRIVDPLSRRLAAKSPGARLIPIHAGGREVGSISLTLGPDTPGLTEIDNRLLSAVAHQLGQALDRLRLQSEATDAEVLRRTDEMRTALLNAVSHDLRTPLASIIASGGSILQEDVAWSADELRAFAETIVREAERLERLVGSLLELSRIEAGTLQPSKAWYDLPSLLSEVAGRTERNIAGARIALDIPDDLPPVEFDYVEIEQVATNLLENAVRHGSDDVRVSLAAAAGEVRVEVSDNGRGIPQEALPHLFRPFYQAPHSGDRQPGAGLGLAIAQGFVAAHGGRIWAENRQEGGARFVFTLPLPAAAPVQV